MRKLLWWAAPLALGLCLCSSTPALAQGGGQPSKADIEKAKSYFKEGEAHFNLGEYEAAMKAYREAYLLSKAPLLLYNIALCARYLGKYQDAKHNFEAYLVAETDKKSPYRKEAQKAIEEIDAILVAKSYETKSPVQPAPPPVSAAPVVIQLSTPEPQRKTLRIALLGGAVGTALVGGLALSFALAKDEPIPNTDLGAQPSGF
jgi:tetratricopeptide (TPR) repeat protein